MDKERHEVTTGGLQDDVDTRLDSATYSWVEEPSTDAEEDPDIDSEGESEGQRDVHQGLDVHWPGTEKVVGRLCRCECEEEEQKCANELAQEGDEQMACPVRQPSKNPPLSRAVWVLSVCWLHL